MLEPMREEAFACDAMLGGLARWLRAAGYDARWYPGIADADLVREAAAARRVLLSCDAALFDLPGVRDGCPRSLRLPMRRPVEQLAAVLTGLALPLREPRCMACGGELAVLARDEARRRVPPGAFAGVDRFWTCRGCGRVLWRGTHWRRIAAALATAAGSGAGAAAR
jgi:uncharacterized protein with PIN domain